MTMTAAPPTSGHGLDGPPVPNKTLATSVLAADLRPFGIKRAEDRLTLAAICFTADKDGRIWRHGTMADLGGKVGSARPDRVIAKAVDAGVLTKVVGPFGRTELQWTGPEPPARPVYGYDLKAEWFEALTSGWLSGLLSPSHRLALLHVLMFTDHRTGETRATAGGIARRIYANANKIHAARAAARELELMTVTGQWAGVDGNRRRDRRPNVWTIDLERIGSGGPVDRLGDPSTDTLGGPLTRGNDRLGDQSPSGLSPALSPALRQTVSSDPQPAGDEQLAAVPPEGRSDTQRTDRTRWAIARGLLPVICAELRARLGIGEAFAAMIDTDSGESLARHLVEAGHDLTAIDAAAVARQAIDAVEYGIRPLPPPGQVRHPACFIAKRLLDAWSELLDGAGETDGFDLSFDLDQPTSWSESPRVGTAHRLERTR